MIVVFVIVLVVFGPQKLPELARGLGKLMAEFRKASTDFKSAFENEMRDLERQAADIERKKRDLLATTATVQPQHATLATPSGSETQSGPAALAPSDAERGASQALVIAPVAESVARSTEPAESVPLDATSLEANMVDSAAGPHSLEIAPENGKRPAAEASPRDLDAPHDYKQPA